MDPLITVALGTALWKVAEKLGEKALVDPGLDKGLEPFKSWLTGKYDRRKAEDAIRTAVDAALAKTGPAQTLKIFDQLLYPLQQTPDLATRVAAAVTEMATPDPSRLPPDLVADLNLKDEYRAPFARFLGNLRSELASIEVYKAPIAYANQLHSLLRLDGIYEVLVALVEKGLWVRPLPPDTQILERPYLEYVMKDCGRLSLEGRAKEEAVAGRRDDAIRLEQVYIALNTTGMRNVSPKEEDEVRGRTGIVKPETRPLSALQAVIESRHLVLLGDPGSGKSTLARHLCLCLAGARLEGDIWLERLTAGDVERWELPPYFPIFVRLRDFAASTVYLPADTAQRGQAKHLLNFIKDEIKSQGWDEVANHAQALLENGSALVVFDGLDEITHPNRKATPDNMPKADDDRRAQVAQAVADFAFVRCSRARVIVTCRVKQYDANAPWRLPDFPTYELADFDNKQIREFVGHWFTAVKERIQNADGKRDSLLRALGDRPELEELAPKPILLTQMALVHADNILPDSRVELYHECADLLLWKWERLGRQGQSADDFLKEFGVPGLRRPTIEDALYQAVYFAHQSGQPEIAEDLIRDQLSRAFMAHNLANYVAVGHAQRFIDEWLKGRNGLLLPARGDTFDLPHRSFREYMTARVLVEKGYRTQPDDEGRDWEEVTPGLVTPPTNIWREVFRFAAALTQKEKVVVDALDALWPESAQLSPVNYHVLLLAGETVRDVGPAKLRTLRRGQEVYARIERALVHLMRDSHGGDYGDDVPNNPPIALLPASTRLQAGFLLDALSWTPPDLDAFIHIPEVKGQGFYAAKYLLTNLQYKRFLDSPHYAEEPLWRSLKAFDEKGQKQIAVGDDAWKWFTKNGEAGCRPRYWDDARFGANHHLLPVVGVTWWEAAAYAEWLTRHWWEHEDLKHLNELFGGNFTIRLLREAEWVQAAGGDTKDRYPWGVTAKEQIQMYANTSESDLNRTSPIGMYPLGASQPNKLMDMGGNVWEWQANFYDKDHDSFALRGGSWFDGGSDARVAARLSVIDDDVWGSFVGGRLGVFPGGRS